MATNEQDFDVLVSVGADVHGTGILHQYCDIGALALVKKLVKLGEDINAKIPDQGLTPLSCAIRHPEIFSVLLKAGASTTDVADNYGNTVLHRLCGFGGEESLQVLLDHEKNTHNTAWDINVRGPNEMTPFLYAETILSIPMMKRLAEEGADIHARAVGGRTSLHIVASFGPDQKDLYSEEHANECDPAHEHARDASDHAHEHAHGACYHTHEHEHGACSHAREPEWAPSAARV